MRQARSAPLDTDIRRGSDLPSHVDDLAMMIAKPLSGAIRSWLVDVKPDGRATQGLLQIQGLYRGKVHRVLIAGAKRSLAVTLQTLKSLAARKIRNGADALFIFVSKDIPPEVLFSASELGIFLVLDGSKGRVPQIHFGKAMMVQYRAVDSWALSLELADRGLGGIAFDQGSQDLTFREKPVRNWLSRKSRRMLQAVEADGIERSKFHFKRPLEMVCDGKTIKVVSMDIWFSCRILHRIHYRQSALPDSAYHPLRGEIGEGSGVRVKSSGDLLAAQSSRCERSAQVPGPLSHKPDLFVYVPVEAAGSHGVPDLDRFVSSSIHA